MIQRIQSIFLLLVSAGFWSLFQLPFATSDVAIPEFMADNTYNIMDHVILLLLAVAGGILALAVVFLYTNRTIQLKLNYVLIVLSILLPLLAFLLLYNEGTATVADADIQDRAGLYVMGINIILSFLAARSIQKDNKIVESMDRLR